jgi:hypothetical protein
MGRRPGKLRSRVQRNGQRYSNLSPRPQPTRKTHDQTLSPLNLFPSFTPSKQPLQPVFLRVGSQLGQPLSVFNPCSEFDSQTQSFVSFNPILEPTGVQPQLYRNPFTVGNPEGQIPSTYATLYGETPQPFASSTQWNDISTQQPPIFDLNQSTFVPLQLTEEELREGQRIFAMPDELIRESSGSSVIEGGSILEESGRTYAAYKEGKYWLPNDAVRRPREGRFRLTDLITLIRQSKTVWTFSMPRPCTSLRGDWRMPLSELRNRF